MLLCYIICKSNSIRPLKCHYKWSYIQQTTSHSWNSRKPEVSNLILWTMRKNCVLCESFVGYKDWYWSRSDALVFIICPRNQKGSRDKSVFLNKSIINAWLTSKYEWEILNLSITTLSFIFVNIAGWRKKWPFLMNNYNC